MLGLMLKDFYLLKNQAKVFLIFMVLGIFLYFSGSDSTFPVVFVGILMSMFVVSTIAYDEYDNGFPFLMSLPASKKGYVISKYLFSLLISLASNLWMSLLVLMIGFISNDSIDLIVFIMSVLAGLVSSLVLVAIMIPCNLRFGSESGRYMMMGIFILIGLIGYLFVSYIGIDFSFLLHMNRVFLIICFVCLVLTIWISSILISIKVMEKKEF